MTKPFTAKLFKEESFKELCDLLILYEGVEIVNWNEYEGRFCFRLRISEIKSILYLEYLANGANAGATFYVESLPLDTDSASESLRRLVWCFSFSLNEGSADFDLPEGLRYFGIHLVWDLQARGFLDRYDAGRLLDLWGGAYRG